MNVDHMSTVWTTIRARRGLVRESVLQEYVPILCLQEIKVA
jgi:chorismate mutase